VKKLLIPVVTALFFTTGAIADEPKLLLMEAHIWRDYDEREHLLMDPKPPQEIYFPFRGDLVTLSSILERLDKLEARRK
jgi:hypothetical protein